jgi:hypothetical protein
MREMTWVRFGLAATIAGTAVAGVSGAAGCGGDDNAPAKTTDGGTQDQSLPDTSNPTPEGGRMEASTDAGGDSADAAPMVPNAKVYVVHAATSEHSPPLRFCFGNTTDGGILVPSLGIAPFPDTVLSPLFQVAGLYPGFGGSVTDAPAIKTLKLDLSQLAVALFAVDATKIANDTADGGPDGGAEIPCEKLIGSDGNSGTLKQGMDYWLLGSIAKGTLAHGTTWVAAVTGCPPGEDTSEGAFCPQPYDPTKGNLTLTTWEVDNMTAVPDGGMIGAQFASGSSAWDSVVALQMGAATAAGFWSLSAPVTDAGMGEAGMPESGMPEAGDAGTAEAGDAAAEAAAEAGPVEAGPPPGPMLNFTAITGSGKFGTLSPKMLVPAMLPPYGNTAGFATVILGADGGSIWAPAGCTPGQSCFSPLLVPLPAIDQVTYGAGAPTGGSFVAGKGYVFILVGDPLNPPFINPADGGGTSQDAGVFNSKAAHFIAFPTSNP